MTTWNIHTNPEGRVYAIVLPDHAYSRGYNPVPSIMQYDPPTKKWVGEGNHTWYLYDQVSWAKLPYHESFNPKLFAVEDPK